ncbi:hypothetical protein BC834DRAFT_974094 [Gloeopeniophorella convolvens]|nr:hypothetical protein BC834DRAFT_974094 [Gloeopeniophorella convolvens]
MHAQSVPIENTYSDGSGALFSMYLERAEDEDKKLAESWKGDAEGILVFTGLFSATVATFLSTSFQSLQLNSQDASAFYLAQIYQATTLPNNGSHTPLPSAISDPSSFSPSTSNIWINALWSLSLAISLTCALLATLLQQWTRRYLRVTCPRMMPHKRARVRSFFAEGIDKFRLPWLVEALPALLHLSVFLFFAGFVIFLFNLQRAIFTLILSWAGFCFTLYSVMTFMPTFWGDFPYHTPLSTLVRYCVLVSSWATFRVVYHVCSFFTKIHFVSWRLSWKIQTLSMTCKRKLSLDMVSEAHAMARMRTWEMDGRALTWLWRSLDDDHDLERFIAGLPDLCTSKQVQEVAKVVASLERGDWSYGNLAGSTLGLVGRTLDASSLPNPVRRRRISACVRALDSLSDLLPGSIIRAFYLRLQPDFSATSDSIFTSTELWNFSLWKCNASHEDLSISAQCMAASIAVTSCKRRQFHTPLLMRQLDTSEDIIHRYTSCGNSVLVAIANRFIMKFMKTVLSPNHRYNMYQHSVEVTTVFLALCRVTDFVLIDILPELQLEFLDLRRQVDSRIEEGAFTAVPVLSTIVTGYFAQNPAAPIASPVPSLASERHSLLALGPGVLPTGIVDDPPDGQYRAGETIRIQCSLPNDLAQQEAKTLLYTLCIKRRLTTRLPVPTRRQTCD